MISSEQKLVSVILPVYNRASFMPEALKSICEQTYSHWELIIVDDGSTDGTDDILGLLVKEIRQPVKVIRQSNRGAYAARNSGLEHITGSYVAFFDSDDYWLPHHLSNCVEALEKHPDVVWCYGASKIVDLESSEVIDDNCFYHGEKPRQFLTLPVELRGKLHVLSKNGLFESVLNGAGLYAGLQVSVIRSSFFEENKINADFYNEAEDQLVVLRAIARNVKFGYFQSVHLIYRIHGENSSAASKNISQSKKIRLAEGMIQGLQLLPTQIIMNARSKRLLRRKLADLYFWNLGYNCFWKYGQREKALDAYRLAIKLRPTHLPFWKTYMIGIVKNYVCRMFGS